MMRVDINDINDSTKGTSLQSGAMRGARRRAARTRARIAISSAGALLVAVMMTSVTALSACNGSTLDDAADAAAADGGDAATPKCPAPGYGWKCNADLTACEYPAPGFCPNRTVQKECRLFYPGRTSGTGTVDSAPRWDWGTVYDHGGPCPSMTIDYPGTSCISESCGFIVADTCRAVICDPHGPPLLTKCSQASNQYEPSIMHWEWQVAPGEPVPPGSCPPGDAGAD